MATTKKQKAIREKLKPGSIYKPEEALAHLKDFAANTKFVETVEVACNLGVNAKNSSEQVRGSCVLPHGTGKKVRVAVFAQGENAEKAKKAGADIVGFEDLAEQVKKGDINFDVVIATPDAMRIVGQLGQILGPKNLMPNPKVGTVTMNVEAAVADAKSGQVRFRTDKNGIIHCAVGKIDFPQDKLIENINALIATLKKLKPVSSKGVYFKKVSISTTMGPGLSIDPASLSV